MAMGKKEDRIMLSSLPSSCRRGATTAALALAIVGCERPGTIDHPTVSGRLVQATDVAARAAPLRVRAYELRFSDASEADVQARQRESVAPPITVFELALHYVEVPGTLGPAAARRRLTPLTVRVVVDETTGDATLTRRR